MNDKDLEKLVFGMAHQIRNPAAIIKANANLLLQNASQKPDAKRSLEAILNGVKYLEARLDEFVEFSKPLTLNLKEANLYQLAQEIIIMFKDKCHLQRISMICNIDRSLVLPKADHDQMFLALLNVVLNGMEAIGEDGSLFWDASREDGQISLKIRDTGVGIHPRDLAEVFSPFYSTKAGGIGIGLAVTRRIIEAHKGRIDVESKQGQGTTVTIRLPA